MKYSYEWLKKLSGTEKSAQEIAELLITHAFEVEDVCEQGKDLENVVVGEVRSKEKHPDADRLNVAVVNIGEKDVQIVCGAPNLEAGQKVSVALVGAVLPGDFAIKKSKIRGVESNGMICGEDEIFPQAAKSDGIMVLSEEAVPGTSFAKYCGLDDMVLDIDILPNRGHDVLGHYGMAREIAALEGRVLDNTKSSRQKITEETEGAEMLPVHIETNHVARYVGVQLSGVEVKPSPDWLVARLAVAGIGSINNVVDITNYIMLETGQPTHAFDARGIKDISVRMAQEDEKITLLNDAEVTLDTGDVVITDGTSPIALAGVMGGKDSSVTDATETIIFEVANFDATTVRKTRVRHVIESDAAYRFERELDPNMADMAIAQGIALFQELAGATVELYNDVYPEKVESWRIALDPREVNRLLGVEVAQERIVEILENLGITIVEGEDALLCAIPTWRRDLTIQEDLIEEVGRVYGYDKITPQPLVGEVQSPVVNAERQFERATKNILIQQGLDEIRSYSFYAEEDAAAIGYGQKQHVLLVNPMSSDQSMMRLTLMPGMMRAAVRNMSYFDDVSFFEVGRVYKPQETGLPHESLTLGMAVIAKGDKAEQFYRLKGLVENYLSQIGVSGFYFADVFDEGDGLGFHPSRRAMIKSQSGKILGVIGEVAKKTGQCFGLKKVRVAYCELDITMVRAAVRAQRSFEALPKFPYVYRDLSMRVEPRTRVADVERVFYQVGGSLLKNVDLFDLFVHPDTGERSMAFHFTFGHADHTLTAQEVDTCIADMIASVEKECDVEVRTQ